jgi:hypothetical protein
VVLRAANKKTQALDSYLHEGLVRPLPSHVDAELFKRSSAIQELHKDRCASVFFSTWKRCTDAIDQNSWTEEASSSCLAALASTVLTRVQPFHQIGHVSRTPRN